MRTAVKVTEIIAALEREAGDNDTDPRWLAARCLKYIDDFERRTLMVEVCDDPDVVSAAVERLQSDLDCAEKRIGEQNAEIKDLRASLSNAEG